MKRRNLFILAAIAALLLIVYFISLNGKMPRETFADVGVAGVDSECPITAVRGPDGSITVQPGGKKFGTLSSYVDYLTSLYAKGSKCIPPMVTSNKEPVPGIIGGQGNSVEPPSAFNLQGATRDVLSTDLHNEMTSAKTPINKLDDYEYDRVDQVERGNRNKISTASKNELMEKHRLDWATLPFNSEDRAKQEDTFTAGRMESMHKDPESGVFFSKAEGTDVEPPDVEAQKLREQKLLAAYKPTAVSKHEIDTESQAVARLVSGIYKEDPNWEPVINKVGENKWEVTELRAKPRTEKWEEAQTQTLAMAEANGKSIPPPSIDINDRIRGDPYFDKGGLGDRDNNRFWNYNDFRKWTPGLERMFAPTMENKDWN